MQKKKKRYVDRNVDKQKLCFALVFRSLGGWDGIY